jgi:hypothetical protein
MSGRLESIKSQDHATATQRQQKPSQEGRFVHNSGNRSRLDEDFLYGNHCLLKECLKIGDLIRLRFDERDSVEVGLEVVGRLRVLPTG